MKKNDYLYLCYFNNYFKFFFINSAKAQLSTIPEKINLYNPKFQKSTSGGGYYFVEVKYKNDKKSFKSSSAQSVGYTTKISKTNDVLVEKSSGSTSTFQEAKTGVNLSNNTELTLYPTIQASTFAFIDEILTIIPMRGGSWEPKYLYNFQKNQMNNFLQNLHFFL